MCSMPCRKTKVPLALVMHGLLQHIHRAGTAHILSSAKQQIQVALAVGLLVALH
jgi:hypothetical protein